MLDRLFCAVQFESMRCGPEKSWGSVLKLYDSWDMRAMETITDIRVMNTFAANGRSK